jgi:hypothetical protein
MSGQNLNSISYNNWNIYNASFNSINISCPSGMSPLTSKQNDYYDYYNANISSSSPSSYNQSNYSMSNYINSPNTTNNNFHSINKYHNFGINYDSSLLNNSSGYSSINSSFNNSPSFSTTPRQSVINNSNTSPDFDYQYKPRVPQKRKIIESNKENEDNNTKRVKQDKHELTNDIDLFNKMFPIPSNGQFNQTEKLTRKSNKKKSNTINKRCQNEIINNNYNGNNNYNIISGITSDFNTGNNKAKLIENENNLTDANLIENIDNDFNLNDLDYDESENEDKTKIDVWQNESYESSFNNGEISTDKKKRVLTKSQRIAANQRERKRMNIMNESFDKLRQVLPISTGRKRRKMSRLDIVCGAMEYIAYLDLLLESDEPCEIDFESYITEQYMNFI